MKVSNIKGLQKYLYKILKEVEDNKIDSNKVKNIVKISGHIINIEVIKND